MSELFHYVYSRSLLTISTVILMSVLVWTTINKLFLLERKRCFNLCLFLVAIIIISYITIFNRRVGDKEVCIIPFYSFVMAQEQPEMYRSMFMNALLFVPFGLFLPYVQKDSHRRKIKTTIWLAFLFSFCIEVFQFTFRLGRAEVDDIICNTLGAFIGSLSFVLYRMLEKRRNA